MQLIKQILVDEMAKQQAHLGSSDQCWNDQDMPVLEDQEACNPGRIIDSNADIIKTKLEQKSTKPKDIITQWARISKKNK